MPSLSGPTTFYYPGYAPQNTHMGGFWGTAWGAIKTVVDGAAEVVEAIVPGGGLAVGIASAAIDAFVPDDETSKGIGAVVTSATGRSEGVTEAAIIDRLAIEDFPTWPAWSRQDQVNFGVMQHLAVGGPMGPVTAKEARYRQKWITPKIWEKIYQWGAAAPAVAVMMYGHLVTVKNSVGGMVPVGYTDGDGHWISFTPALAAQLTQPIEEHRTALRRAGEVMRVRYGPQATATMSPDDPEGEWHPAPLVDDLGLDAYGEGLYEADFTWLWVLGGAGAVWYFLLRGRR